MHDLPHAAFVLNLRGDVMGFNGLADALFGFAAHPPERRNLLWLLFTDPTMHRRLYDWDSQAPMMLASFRRDFARATQEADIHALVDELEHVSPASRPAGAPTTYMHPAAACANWSSMGRPSHSSIPR